MSRRWWICALCGVSVAAAAPAHAQDEPAPEVDVEIEDEPETEIEVEPEQTLEPQTIPEDEDGDEVVREPEPLPEDRVDTVYIRPEDLANVGGAAHALGEEQLEAFEYDDPHSVLLQVPGIYIRQEEGFGLRPNIGIRGAAAERSAKITLMEDGVLLAPAPYAAPAAYYFPVVSRMTGVEVFKGPGAILYGPNTIGGAVNWITRPIPFESEGGVDVNVGSYATAKAHGFYGNSNEWGGFLLEAVHWRSDGYKEIDGGGEAGFDKTEVMAKGRLNSDLAAEVFHQLDLKLGWSEEASHETYLGLTDADFRADPYRRYRASQLDEMEWSRTQAQLRYRLEWGRDFDVITTAYRHDFYRDWTKFAGFVEGTSPGEVLASPTGRRAILYDLLTGAQDSLGIDEALIIGSNARTFVSQGIQTRAQHRVSGEWWANQATAGVRVHQDSVRRDHTAEDYLMRGGDLVDADRPSRQTTLEEGRALAFAAWLLDEIVLWRLTVAPGLRVEHIRTELEDELAGTTSEATQTVLIPGVGLHYAFTEDFGALAGVHRGFSPVSPGQPDEVEPETAINYEAGLRYSNASSLRSGVGTLAEVVGFFNDYDNLLSECTFSVGCSDDLLNQQFNAGRVWVWGLEIVAGHVFELPRQVRLPVRATYTLTQSSFQEAFASANPQLGEVEEGDELPYVPEHQVSAQVGLDTDVFDLNVGVTYVGAMREIAGQGELVEAEATDDYAMVDLLASYELLEELEIYGKVDNAFAAAPIASRRPYGARPVRPILAQIGLRLGF